MSATPPCVVKVGGAWLGAPAALDAIGAVLSAAARTRAILVVPGGGPFADLVREEAARRPLPAETAHWMAVLAMDQVALLLAARWPSAALVRTPAEGPDPGLALLRPEAWLRAHDTLPHSWDVTSDSIAALVARATGSPLVLVKRGPLDPALACDPYFPVASAGLEVRLASAGTLGDALAASSR